MTQLKTPPHSADMEEAILGGVLLSPAALDEVMDIVSAEDFYTPEHREIFKACVALSAAGKAVDVLAVADSLPAELGDAILNLAENSRGTVNILHYARGVKEKALARKLIAAGYSVADLGYNCADISEAIDTAQSVLMAVDAGSDESVAHVDQVAHSVVDEIDRRSTGGIIGLSTHFTGIDNQVIGLEPGDFVVVAGRPSMGKTTFAMNIAERNAINDKTVLVFSLEMSKESLMMRAYSSVSKLQFAKLRRGAMNDEDWPELTQAVGKFKGKQLFIDDTPAITSAQVRSRARKLQRRVKQPIDLIVVDYIQIMGDKVDGNDNSRVTSISRNLKAIAKEFACPLIALSQLNRSVETRQNKRPTMSDLRESGALEQDADLIIMMYRDEYYNEHSHLRGLAEAIITKQRNGPTGTVHLRSQLENMRFIDHQGDVPNPPPETRGGFAFLD